jgi:hypothetical protein
MHVDGNAVGGLLFEVFGRDLTAARGCCAGCGSVHQIGAMVVFRGPADVLRCPTCESVVAVVVTIHERSRVHLAGIRWLEPEDPD